MNAVEDLAGLDDAPRFAVCDLDERVLSGSINAGEPQHGDGGAAARAEFLPGALGGEPLAAACQIRTRRRCPRRPMRRHGRRKRRPSTDRRSTRRLRACGKASPNAARTGSPFSFGRNRNQRAVRFGDGAFQLGRRQRAVERQSLQPAGSRAFRTAARSAPRTVPTMRANLRRTLATKCSARIAEAETHERGHRRSVLHARPSHSAATSGSVSARADCAHRDQAARGRAGPAPRPPRRGPAARDRRASVRLRSPARHCAELPIAISTLRTNRVAADALDRALGEQRAKRRIVERAPDRQARGARNASRARRASFRCPACANLFHGQTARQSSQP